MKNSDSPAMPVSFNEEYQCSDGLPAGFSVIKQRTVNHTGLTKREMFAMHAPCVSPSFAVEFASKNKDDKSLVEVFSHNKAYKLTLLGDMKLLKAWRYAYADMMLGE